MNYASVFRVTALGGLVLAVLYLVTGLIALMARESALVLIFIVPSAVITVISGITLLSIDKPERPSRPIDGLAVALLFWLLAPIALSVPFLPVVDQNGPVLLLGIYEAVSNLTTTGHSLVAPSVVLPASLIVWRATLHLLGAIAFITMAMTVFAALNLGGPGIHRTRFFTIPREHFFDAVTRSLRLVVIFTLATTALICFLLLVGGIAPRDALALSTSVITTGLVDPDLAVQPVPGLSEILVAIIVIGLCLGTLGVIFADSLSRFELR
ncbi:MAG: hypothetical protein AAF296_10050, partial [Pseudomonadota bacterium]